MSRLNRVVESFNKTLPRHELGNPPTLLKDIPTIQILRDTLLTVIDEEIERLEERISQCNSTDVRL